MYKHSTTHRTLSRRLAALLAAMALLAALALPVYAEALDNATQMQETVETDNNGETDNNVEAGSDVETDDKSETNEGTDTGTGTDSDGTNDNASPNPGANSTAPADNAAADKTAPCEEKTDLTEEDTADDEEGPADEAGAKETFFVADTCSEDETGSSDMSAPMAASNEGETTGFIPTTATIYFEDNGRYDELSTNGQNCTMRFLGFTGNGKDAFINKVMEDTGTTVTVTGQNGTTIHKIFKITLNSVDYPAGGFYRIAFQYYIDNNSQWKEEINAFGRDDGNNTDYLTAIDLLAGKKFVRTGTEKSDKDHNHFNQDQKYNPDQWKRVEYYYAGMPLYFKNASGTPLADVTATFYKKDETGDFVVTGSQTIGTVEANTIADQKITIPNNQSQLVKFTWEGNGEGTLYYNFSNDGCDEATHFDLAANNCFVYSGSAESPWQNAGADLLTSGKNIYFDATLSSYAYTGDGDIHQKPMPGKDGTMYCYLTDGSNNIIKQQMTLETAADGTDRKLWSCTVPDGGPFTAVQFSAREGAEENSAVDALTKQYSTAEIPPNLKAPCFFADDGDPSAYTSGNDVCREGYWDEKDAIRDAESGKGTTVVDIAIASKPFTQEAGTKYITSTLYDYYTDYELNGFNRDTYPDSTTTSQRGFVTFEQFDRALSSAYTNGNVKYPLYTGHFQPSLWANKFADVAPGMSLYGWNDNVDSQDYKTFMAVNNSVLDTDGKATDSEAGYARTFQGLVEDKTSTGDANGLPVLKGKTGTGSLVDPHFNKEFLEGENTFKTVLGKVYENVAFPFTQDAVFKNDSDRTDKENVAKYWYYDSSQSSLYLTQDEGNSKFFLESTKNKNGELITDSKSENRNYKNDGKGTHGFFPFNKSVGSGGASQYNYGFGAKLQFDFTLTDDGMVQVGDKPEDKVPIKFFFSGDDDVWVYIDGQLVLDVGGAHGKASGLLEFGKTDDGKANTVTPYVSSNKTGGETYTDGAGGKSVYFNGKEVKFEKKGTIHGKDGNAFTLAKGTTHTLTMYYMERGMWESNMAVAFNFPDHNELQVEKKVDVTGVNKLFQDSFQNQKIFTFNIQNLATHYGEKETSYKKGETKALPAAAYTGALNPSDTSAKLEYVEKPPKSQDGDLAVLWSATMDDPTSKYREQRRGTLSLNESINIRQYSYLTFDVYVKSKKGNESDTCALGNLYVELWDTQGHQKGCLGTKGLQSSDVYGAATALHQGQWYTIRLLLNSLETSDGFNNNLKYIKVGDNFAREIYLRNFTFRSAPEEQTTTGFTTEQYNIPDYGSAETGTLQNAAYAVFSSDRGNGDVVDEDGQFLLQAGETVTFKDQFRRGSYIALKELTDTELYDTSWTVYENGEPVTTLKDVPGTAPKDGRTEPVIEGTDNKGNPIKNKYVSPEQKPNDNTLVFRSYSGTADKDELTKLKVVFTNKVKTGKLIIRKEPAPGEKLENQEFTFTVKFSDVGGQGLGNEIEPQTYTCKVEEHADGYYGKIVIDKIPVGTRFVVSEDAHKDTSLQSVSITGGGTDCAVTEDGKRVRGAIAEGDANAVKATFVNTRRQLIDIEVTKQWKKQDGKTGIPNNELPKAIYLKLQRTKTPNSDNNWEDVTGYDSVELKREYGGWVAKFTGLDKFDATNTDGTHEYYTYRVLESATTDGTFYGGSEGNVIEIDGKKYTILKNTVQVEENSASPLALNLTNKQQDPKFTLDITKADAEDGTTPLKSVEFKLEKLDENNNVVENSAKYGITNDQGKLMSKGEDGNPTDNSAFTGLEAGKYRLTETKAAENYNLLSAPILVTFDKDGTCTLNSSKIEVSTSKNKTEFTKNGNDRYTLALTVLNRKTPTLPHTGADAPSLWLLIGLPLAVAGLLILVFRYNKKGGRTR